MDFEEKKISSEHIFKGRVVDLYVDEVLLPDGTRSKREYIRHSGGAAVLFIKDGKTFNELIRGNDTRKEFFNKIIEVVTLLGGDNGNVL